MPRRLLSLLASLVASHVTCTVVHPLPGGETVPSPFYAVTVDGQKSFVWYTSVANRQPVASGNNVPLTSANKDTSFSMFDMSWTGSAATIAVDLLQSLVTSVEVRPSSAGIVATIAPSHKTVTFTMTKPGQACLIFDHNIDKPLCIFADPPQTTKPSPSADVIVFEPGVHYAGQINVTANQTVYLAGGAHVYGQVVAVPGLPCSGVKVLGRGVLDGHKLPIDYRANAMIEVWGCDDIRVEGITTIDSPQYQIMSGGANAVIRFAKAIAWGFSTDGWSSGAYATIENCFFKVNDDSTKLYSTGMLVQHNVYWQMENGCPLMISWNNAINSGFVTARDNDIIAHEKRAASVLDGVIGAWHGGHGNLNNYLFDGLRIEGSELAFVSISLLYNPWAPPGQSIGNISTLIFRNVTASAPFTSLPKDAYHMWGNSSASRLDTVIFDNVMVGGKLITTDDINDGIGPFATNITACSACVATMFPSLMHGQTVWSSEERCGETPQPLCDGSRLPALSAGVGSSAMCKKSKALLDSQPQIDPAALQRPCAGKQNIPLLLQMLNHSSGKFSTATAKQMPHLVSFTI